MYGIFTNIWVIYGANVGKYSIHGSYGYGIIWLEDGWKMGIIWNNMGQSSHAGQLFKGEMDVSYVEDGKRWENNGGWRI